jgi:glycosyltransferase involved in cell wall biosynthesis
MKVLIYVGYQQKDLIYEDFQSGNQIGGTEIVALQLAETLANWGVEIFFGGQLKPEWPNPIKNGVEWLNLVDCGSKHFDVVISASYLHFIDTIDAKYKFLWMHNTDWYDWYRGQHVFGQDAINRWDLTGIITLTDWHKNQVIRDWNIQRPVYVIGNAIDRKSFGQSIQKRPNSFIYSSAPERGLYRLLEMWPEIKVHIPDATLDVFTPGYAAPLVNNWPDGVTFRGTASQQELHKWQAKTEFWLHPTDYEETYCITAVEAQMNGAIPVTTDLAALHEVVGKRGILLPIGETNQGFINIIKELAGSPERKQKLRLAGFEWAKQQTWNVRIQEWLQLINSYAN